MTVEWEFTADRRRGRPSHVDPARRRRGRAVGHPVHELRAHALRLHDAAFARFSSAACSTTGSGGAMRRSIGCMRCAARLDSGPGRRLGVIKAAPCAARRVVRSGGSASELHVLEVIRDAGLPRAGAAAPGARRRPVLRARLRVAGATGLRRVLRPRRALGRQRRRPRQRPADCAGRAPAGVRSSSPTRRPTSEIVARRRERCSRTHQSDGALERPYECLNRTNLMGRLAT